MGSQKQDKVGVVMVPFPIQSHLSQLLQLSQLISTYKIPVHYAGSATHNHQVKLRDWKSHKNSNIGIQFHDFQLPPYSVPPPNPNANCNAPSHLRPLRLATSHLRQPISELLQELGRKYRRVIVIHDTLMASVVQDVKSISNAEVYTFHVTSTFTLFFNAWQFIDEKPFKLDLSDDILRSIPSNEGYNSTSEFVDFVVNQSKLSLELASGRINNSCRLIEGDFIDLFQKLPRNLKIKHYPLGPFNPVDLKHNIFEEGIDRHSCLKWLDQQEKNSVIYVSFGTLTSLPYEQIEEIAIGLEGCGQKFIWVLRSPDKGDIFAKDDTEEDMIRSRVQVLDGFEERVNNRGLVVAEWIPQLDILAHPATGGFMSHCGWVSCVESISMGVPIVAWPITSDQPKNSVLVTEFLRVGILVRPWEQRSETLKSATVANVVRRLMRSTEGEEIRKRAAKLGCDIRASRNEQGTAPLVLDDFVAHVTR